MILGVITTLLGGLGIIGVFIGTPILIIIGGAAGILENFLGITSGQQNSLATAVLAAIIGGVVGVSTGAGLVIGILGGLCFEVFLMGVIGWFSMAAIRSRDK